MRLRKKDPAVRFDWALKSRNVIPSAKQSETARGAQSLRTRHRAHTARKVKTGGDT
jgi:hypothetical protein